MEDLEKNNIKDKIRKVTFGLLLILLIICLAVSVFYNVKLQEQVDKRDVIIERLTQRDSILNKILEIKYDSISHTTSYTYLVKGGKVMKYNELANELDKTHDDYILILNEHNKLLKENNQNIDDYNLLIKNFNSIYKDYKESQNKYNNLVDNYNTNIVSTKKYLNNYNLILDSLSNYKTIFNLIHSHYFLDYKIENDGKYRKISIKSEKLDSALILLPYFRDRLRKEKNSWKITIDK
jgi:hypothetical protein